MKKLIYIMMLSMSSVCFSQIQNRSFAMDKALIRREFYLTMQAYVEYCKSDSVVVGWRFITHEDSGSQQCFEVFSPRYYNLTHNDYYNRYLPHDQYTESLMWAWIVNEDREIYMQYEYPYTHKQYSNRLGDYIRCEKILSRSETPTFEGFYEWFRKRLLTIL